MVENNGFSIDVRAVLTQSALENVEIPESHVQSSVDTGLADPPAGRIPSGDG
jgi:hypothetical protein